MPGIIMDKANVGGTRWEPDADDFRYGPTSLASANETASHPESKTESVQVNGAPGPVDTLKPTPKDSAADAGSNIGPPPELAHITQGFFPFTTLVNRSVQQCWNDLSDLVTELAEIQVPSQGQGTAPVNGKPPGTQSPENVHKKLRVLDFAHGKRTEFIKLLVLSQWGRQAADVSKLIDVQGFIRSRHQAYAGALQWLGDMKRGLVMAQVANPDLKTALEVLTKGKVVAMSDLGYKPPKPLTVKSTLKKLQKLNRVISVRLALHDQLPYPFQSYRVHDGRVTFHVPGEFELDLSVGDENRSSQFFFVDIRFLFSPSSPIPKGWILNELDMKVNNVLHDRGLTGCFDFLHSLVLTNKVQTFFKQAISLARGLWSDALRVELLHRTLVVQYWASKPGAKNWIEIGVKSGRQHGRGAPYLGLRWMRDGQEVDSGDIQFDADSISMECVLRSVIALHISHILASAHAKLSETLLVSTGELPLQTLLSTTEPANCELNIRLTLSRRLRVSMESMSGASILSATPNALERPEGDRSPDKSSVDDIVSRVSRLRCTAAIEEVESNMKILGFDIVNPRSLRYDARKIFPSNVLRFSFFSHRLWGRNWILAAASSMDSDNWWLIPFQNAVPGRPNPGTNMPFDADTNSTTIPRSAKAISTTFHPAQQPLNYASFADLGHCLSGILAVHANAHYLSELQCFAFHPPLQRLQVESGLQVPDLFIRYEPAKLPPALRIALPGGLKKKSFIKDTVRLAYNGIDAHTGAAMMVAYGNLLIPVKSLGALVPKCEDRSLVFQHSGTGFALRLLAPVGDSVMVDLIRTLQRLESALSIVESLQHKKMAPQSLSLSRIAFTYNHERSSSAVVHMDSGPLSTQNVEPAEIALGTDPLFVLRLSISFGRSMPQRRIQESLTAILNSDSSNGGFDSAMEILSLTLPLLQALDRMTANSSGKGLLKAQVTVHGATSYRIHYPAHQYRFQIIAGQHLNRMAWIIRDVSGAQDRSGQAQLVAKLKDGLYDSKGDGWRGLGNGVVAEADKVGNLLLNLDKCFDVVQEAPGTNSVPGQRKPNNPTANSKPAARNTAPGAGVPSAAPRPGGSVPAGPTSKPGPSKDPDPILIE